MDPILGQIILWPVMWVPEGWHLCDGTLLNVQQYQALFSLIGNKYGGDGTNTFAVPDLRMKFPIGTQVMGGVGLLGGSASSQTSATGVGQISIGINNLPSHTHTAVFVPGGGGGSTISIGIPAVSASTATTDIPGTGVSLAKTTGPAADIYSTADADTTLAPFDVQLPAGAGGSVVNGNTGGGQPLSFDVTVPVSVATIPPYMTLNYIIALQGIYPPRP